jgi:ABC-2 type transport system permease protein
MFKKEIFEQWRTFRLPVVVIVFLFFGFLSPLTAKFLPEIIKMAGGDSVAAQLQFPTPTAKDAIDQFLKNLGQFGPLAAILLAMGAVATEKERGTAALVLVKPVSRSAFLMAKLAGLSVTMGAAIAAAGLANYFYTAILFEALPLGGYIAGCLLTLIVMLVFIAITLLASTVVNSAVAAGAIGIAIWISLGLVSVIPKVGEYLPTALFTPARELSLNLPVTTLAFPLLVSLALICGALGAAWLSFRQQEL